MEKPQRNLIVCSDGTWNNPNQTDRNKNTATNVFKIAKGLDLNDNQVLFYDKGVGSGWKGRKIVEGFTGAGISKNIMDAYKFIATEYQKEDKLYLFGFSRGAFTVRSLYGLIYSCGLLKKEYAENDELIWRVFKAYQLQWETNDLRKEYTIFKEKHTISLPDTEIRIGIWDTVKALGIPLFGRSTFPWNKFHLVDYFNTNKNVKVFHAVAADELRRQFPLVEIAEKPKSSVKKEVWFVGSHSNVGGGYSDTGLSDITLEWMIKNMEEENNTGLRMKENFVQNLRPDAYAEFRNSRTGHYKLLPMNIRKFTEKDNKNNSTEMHSTVLERHKLTAMDYNPKSLSLPKEKDKYSVSLMENYSRAYVTLAVLMVGIIVYYISTAEFFLTFLGWLASVLISIKDGLCNYSWSEWHLWYIIPAVIFWFYLIAPVLWYPAKWALIKWNIAQLKKANAYSADEKVVKP